MLGEDVEYHFEAAQVIVERRRKDIRCIVVVADLLIERTANSVTSYDVGFDD